ncbi:MAG: helix-turn-helix domain-containing protein [Oscillospiraceae bacterium]|jgi:DNA-binding Xre family transcriptional regulator|nr:Transcriptional regulator, XRE family [Ruminococcaceae bacterium BL-4]
MTVNYKKLWYFLLNRGENVTTGMLEKICKVLNCTADDIMEFVSNKK